MKRKDNPAALVSPNRMTMAEFEALMRQLLAFPPFQALQSQWLNLESEILEAGKKAPSVEQWAVLKGFHLAVMEPGRWANRTKQSDEMKRRQDELLSILGGEKK